MSRERRPAAWTALGRLPAVEYRQGVPVPVPRSGPMVSLRAGPVVRLVCNRMGCTGRLGFVDEWIATGIDGGEVPAEHAGRRLRDGGRRYDCHKCRHAHVVPLRELHGLYRDAEADGVPVIRLAA